MKLRDLALTVFALAAAAACGGNQSAPPMAPAACPEPIERECPACPTCPECLMESSGLVTIPSSNEFAITVKRLEKAIRSKGMVLLAKVDHKANAKKAKLELLPTTLLLFGNPAAGTPLMQAQRSIAIDLPQKILVWQDEAGKVFLTYNAVEYLRARHDLENQDDVLGNVSAALEALANEAATAK